MLTKINSKGINDSGIQTVALEDSAVTTAKINDDAVTNAKILDGAIDYDKLAAALIASQEEAEAGTAANKLMTPQRSKQYADNRDSKLLLQTIDADNDSTIVFNNLGAFKRYRIEIDDLLSSADADYLVARTSSNNGVNFDAGASDYKAPREGRRDGGSVDTEGSAATNRMTLAVSETHLSTAPGEYSYYEIEILNPSNENAWTMIRYEHWGVNLSSNPFYLEGSAARLEAAIVDAIELSMDDGDIAEGQFRLYGIR